MRFHEILSEKAPPGKKAKRFIKKATPDFKKRYGDAWKQVLYATAWKVFGESYAVSKWRRWWTNYKTGETLSVPNGVEHDAYLFDNLNRFLTSEEAEEALGEHPDPWESVDSILTATYAAGWQAVLLDEEQHALCLRSGTTRDVGKMSRLASRLAAEVLINEIAIDIEVDGGWESYRLKSDDLERFYRTGALPRKSKVSESVLHEGHVEMIDHGETTKVLVDPSVEMVKNLALSAIRRNGGNLRLRGICPDDKILYLWDAWDATHGDIGEAMGLVGSRYSEATEFEVSGLTVEPTKLGWSDLWDNRYIENVQAGARQAIEYRNSLVESLTKSQDLIPMDGQETARRYGLRQIIQAYRFDVGDKEFAVYFDECGGDPKDLTVGFGFFKPTQWTEKHFTHDVTNHRIPFSVLSSVLEAIRTFLITKNPPTISFKGASPRHHQFYLKLISKLEGRLPPGYFVAFHTYDSRLYISRDRTVFKSSRMKPFSEYGTINESDDYDIRYDRFFWKANRIIYTIRAGDHANAVQLFPEKFGLTKEEVERYPINPEGVTHKDVANANKLIELALSKGWTRCNTYRGMLMIHAPSEDLAIRAFRSLYKEHYESIWEIFVEYGPNPEMPIRTFRTDDYDTIRKFVSNPKAYLSGGKS